VEEGGKVKPETWRRAKLFRFHEALLTERLAELRNTSPNITSEDLPILIKVFHPDAEHDASPTRKKQLTAGMQIINRIKEGLERAKKKKR
jgi:hypothetical protein